VPRAEPKRKRGTTNRFKAEPAGHKRPKPAAARATATAKGKAAGGPKGPANPPAERAGRQAKAKPKRGVDEFKAAVFPHLKRPGEPLHQTSSRAVGLWNAIKQHGPVLLGPLGLRGIGI